ncbi:POK9 protein, partial [Myiagra hebetior]|nr:POK9 protein [Myiagra hebetior]
GSLGLDLATAIDIILIDRAVVRVPTGALGLVVINGQAHGALLLGRSSSAMKGLCVIPGVTDADYKGEICIMLKTDFPPIHIPQGSKIAQLVPLPNLAAGITPAPDRERETGGFGSTGTAALLSLQMARRPTVTAAFTYKGGTVLMPALLDIGADVTIMS